MRDKNYYNQTRWRELHGNMMEESLQIKRPPFRLNENSDGRPRIGLQGINHIAKIQCEDTALVLFKFKENKTGIMEATTAMRPHNVEDHLV